MPTAGVDYQRSKEQQQQQQQQQGASDQQGAAAELGAGGTPERVQLGVFWQCLEVTFFYEHCLLYIRREAFRKDKKCECSWLGWERAHYVGRLAPICQRIQ
jgi:hypothetical protein